MGMDGLRMEVEEESEREGRKEKKIFKEIKIPTTKGNEKEREVFKKDRNIRARIIKRVRSNYVQIGNGPNRVRRLV